MIKINVLLALMLIASFIIAIMLHEWAHATMAFLLGDRMPRSDGRQALRPRAHLDPLGTLMCIVLAFQPLPLLPLGFGWGRPVKLDAWKMRLGPNRGVLLVACAGPLFSLLVGVVAAIAARFFLPAVYTLIHRGGFLQLGSTNFVLDRLLQFLVVFSCVNICLFLFNLLPFYPLDGYQILYTLLPSKQALSFARSATYGPFIILVLFFVLPFIGRLTQTSDFFLFNLASYIGLGALNLVGLITGVPGIVWLQIYIH